MPQKKKAASLKHLCLVKIAKNMDFWCHDYTENFAGKKVLYVVGPFDCLAQELVQELIVLLRKEHLLKRINLHLLIEPRMERLSLPSTGVVKDAHLYDGLVELISVRCHKLKYLNFSYCKKIPSKALTQLAHSLPNIQSLHLHAANASDSLLSVLGGHCHELRELDVSLCSQVTDAGISALCVDLHNENEPSGCLKLQSLFVEETSVTDIGALCALNHLPRLKHFHSYDVCVAFYNYFRKETSYLKNEEHALKKFQLQDLWIIFCEWTQSQCLSVLEIATEACPDITKLTAVIEEPLQHGLLITRFKQLQELTLAGRRNNILKFDSQICPILQIIGPGLKYLQLQYIENFNMYAIGKSCPSIKGLAVYDAMNCSGSIANEASAAQPFSHLRTVQIVCCDDFSGMSYDHLLHMLSSAGSLQDMQLTFCQELTDPLMNKVLELNLLPHMESLHFEECNNINIDSLIELMKLQNPLRCMKLFRCRCITNADYHLLLKMMKDENYDMKIEWT